MERRLSAILVADLVGYSAMMGADESRALESIRLLRNKVLEPKVENWHGKIVKRLGDGWIAEFSSAVDAVACALEIQRELQNVQDLEMRIGLHVGDIVHEDGEIYGDGVNIAARLETAGAPGLVLISDDIRRHISGKITETFHDLGNLELKNIAEPVRVWSWPDVPKEISHAIRSGRKPRIHVSEFETRGTNAEDLAEAIRDDLVTTFSRQSGVNLVTTEDNADFVVTGSIHAAGNRWRVSARMLDRTTGNMAWSDRFNESGDDLFEIQDRCVTRIAGAVRIRLPALLSRMATEKSLEEMSVEDLLNYAMNCHYTPTFESWDNAVPSLSLALTREDENWMAMTMLCFNIVSRQRIIGWRRISEPDLIRAGELINSAKSIKPDSEVVRLVYGIYQLYGLRNHDAARIEAEESLRLNPDYYHSIDLMSQIELFTGNLDAAENMALKAIDCDPGYPYLHLYERDLGYVWTVANKHLDAVNRFQRADQAATGLPQNLVGIAVSALLGGETDAAQKAIASLLELAPDFNLEEYDPWPFSDTSDWGRFHEVLALHGIPVQG